MSKESVIRHWKAKKRRYDFVRRRLKRILPLSMQGWPYMSRNRDYIKWLDIVYEAKDKGLYSLKTSTCDIIANIYEKAKQLSK